MLRQVVGVFWLPKKICGIVGPISFFRANEIGIAIEIDSPSLGGRLRATITDHDFLSRCRNRKTVRTPGTDPNGVTVSISAQFWF